MFYGVSTLVGYLMPNPVYASASNVRFVNEYFVGNILNKFELIYLHTVKWFQYLQ